MANLTDWTPQVAQTKNKFGYAQYRRMVLDNLNEQVANLEITKAQRDEYLAEIDRLITANTSFQDLPDYDILKGLYATSYGSVIVPGKVIFLDDSYYTPEGLPLSPQTLQRETTSYYGTGDQGLTEYQQQELALSRQQMAESTRRWEAEQAASAQKAMTAEDFERFRQLALQDLEKPADWISRWQKMHQPNPFIQQQQGKWYQQSPLGVLAGKNWGVMTPLERAATEAMGGYANPKEELAPGGIEQYKAQMTPQEKSTYEGRMGQGDWSQAKGGTPMLTQAEAQKVIDNIMSEAGLLAQSTVTPQWQPSTPPAPSWLPQFAPSQVAGQPITKGEVLTPSGQQWTLTPPSVREGLKGYAAWAGGGSLEDIEQQMQIMQPSSPRAAGYTNWTPRRQ